MQLILDPQRPLHTRNPLLYGQFLEHFHRQIYSGVFDPTSPLADGDGFREDVLEAVRALHVPIIRWPGGCFVSSYHWGKGVGPKRTPAFDKAWRVEDPNTFGTDEFITFCKKIGCEPYICTNAGTGTAKEMSDWVEYCNLENEGEHASRRIANGFAKPHSVKYWSIGNENYGDWEIGAKSSAEWSRLVVEAAKMMKRVDPSIELSAAALDDTEWNMALLKSSAPHLTWISIHAYWDPMWTDNTPSDYRTCMTYTNKTDTAIRKVRGLLCALGLERQIRIAVDEWNLRGWHHPKSHTLLPGLTKEEYLTPRDLNDINSIYTMADAVFSAAFLNTCLRNGDQVGMANFAPLINTRGAIFTHAKGIVKRSTYYVFEMYANLLGDTVIDSYTPDIETWQIDTSTGTVSTPVVDAVALRRARDGAITLSLLNKHDTQEQTITLPLPGIRSVRVTTLCGNHPDDFNDIDRRSVVPFENGRAVKQLRADGVSLTLPPHSVNIVEIVR